MRRVLVSDDLSAEAVKIMQEAGLAVDVRTGLTPEALEAVIGGYDALAVRSATKVTARLLEKAVRLKVVGRAGVGVDNVDLQAATRRGVVVMNTPGGSAVTVAELALAMMASLSRHVAAATASVKAGKWEKKKFQGHELSGKTLGVVGIGNIGSALVERCQGIKMKVLAYDPFISPDAAAKLGVTLVALDELWRQADVISLHVPITDQTRNMVNAGTLAKMKRGAILINCARGGIVDERALAEALASGHLGGAALDVYEKEPPPPDHPLFKLDNVVLTPHLGASTEEAQAAVAVAIADQLVRYLQTGEVRNAVNVPSLPRDVLAQLGPFLPLAETLGSLCGQLLPAGTQEIMVSAAGDLATAPVTPLANRVLVGMLRHVHDTPVNEVNAPSVARERGLKVREERVAETGDYGRLLTVGVRGLGGEIEVAGTVYGRGEARVVRVGAYRLEGVPSGHIILCENDDSPGVIGNLGTALGEAGVNIARISLSRTEDRRSAFAFLNVDSAPAEALLERLRAAPHVRTVKTISL
jgi:D-3-phosphoglycerate dehydrogenase/(S)-sulfolactate dehydrogenase